jgi:isoleucyl-tRNA synthetase
MNFSAREEDVLRFWEEEHVFEKSLEQTRNAERFVFFDGPPTANGRPHVGHVLTRSIKDLFPRYKTMNGYYVARKAGWDTHGLPVELEVEKHLGISGKPQIEDYGVEAFIQKCKESVFTYESEWRRMTERVGFWLDMDHPYVTYHDNYIESVWWALKTIWDKGLLYKGHKVVPYCPRCGTALSSHELAQGYHDVEEASVYVRFPVKDTPNTYFLVWTTTPWTLPSNVAICVHPNHDYVLVQKGDERFILAEALVQKLLGDDVTVLEHYTGKQLEGKAYTPPFNLTLPEGGKAHFVVNDTYVTLTDGTGIVHIAPAFGEDDARVGRQYSLAVLQPVDPQGKFTAEVPQWQGRFVKEADPDIIRYLRDTGLLFKREQHKHSYPFCWRCDTPLIYYARPTWFIRTTAIQDRLLELNQGINWIPDNIKDGRFGDFLENIIDWGLSRERYWGTPLPVWTCDSCGHQHCVGSKEELKAMAKHLPEHLELHKPYIDEAVLKCPECGGDMHRTSEVIDCWFDSGSMPFAQWHYPFENQDLFKDQFPATFISEAVDQTRGWFYTLLVISTLLFDKSPFENCMVLGLVLDEKGIKQSKHKGNVTDPWDVFAKQGADAVRWYLYSNSDPWLPTRFYNDAVSEAQRKFLGTLWNVYSFFVLYANIDGFEPQEHNVPVERRAELDRWIISRFNHLVAEVRSGMDNYDVTGSARKIQEFVDDLSNWYVRRSRDRYWQEGWTEDKEAAYLTLYEVLVELSKVIAPFVPFISEEIYQNLARSVDANAPASVHLCRYPVADESRYANDLEAAMSVAMHLVAAGRSARAKANVKVRQPLGHCYLVVKTPNEVAAVEHLADVILDELNIKAYETVHNLQDFAKYTVKPRFDLLGPKLGKKMPLLAKAIAQADPVALVEAATANGSVVVRVGDEDFAVLREELDVRLEEKPGFAVEGEAGYYTVLDTALTPELVEEGLAREIVSKVQTMRKDADFAIEDRIRLSITGSDAVKQAVERYRDYIAGQTLAVEITPAPLNAPAQEWEVNGESAQIAVERVGK